MLRIKEIRKARKINQQEIADYIGVTQATFSGWENEKFEIDNASLIKIAEYFEVTTDYILGRENSSVHSSGEVIRVPVLGYVAAGIPIEAIEDILDYEELDPSQFDGNYKYFGLKIKGDSMTPRIQDGDVVIVRQQPDIESGDVAIVCINGDEATCKQIKKHPEGISLMPFNNSYGVKFYTNKEIETLPVTILGKVVELRGKF